MTYLFSLMIKATSTSKPTATLVSNVFLHHWIVLNGILNYLLTKDGPQCFSKILIKLCKLVRLKHLTVATQHP